ncbi:MAG: tyrosine-type recombinase/integrase [Candidatus Moraniibacteriota bacterium]
MEEEKGVVNATAFYDKGDASDEKKVSTLVEGFLDYARYELNFSPKTIEKYRDSLKSFVRSIGDKDVRGLDVQDFVSLKKEMMQRGLSEARIASVVFATRSLLNYCRNFLKLETLNPKQIRPPKRFKREVIFLTKDEVEAFIATIDINRIAGLRFRALVEVLLGTGMRISEALSLDRKSIDWEKREAKIIGKGNKERRVFFTEKALEWVRKYLEARTDSHEAIFITTGEPSRLSIGDIWRFFKYHREKAHIHKKLTPHILRHTVATNLVFNGCPIVHVKEILGHEKLDTTCKYYLGVDKEQAKKAHNQYLAS